MTLEQGDLLSNRYRILDILGRGGMGSVYHAIDESLGVEVAVKENLFVTEEYEQQFRLEAVILASLRHPNLPRVTDHFTIDGQGQYLVMDYIEGRDLRHMMEAGPVPEAEAIRIGVAVCDALVYLHTRRPPVLHRDIKPGNVRIAPDGQVYLVDFGLAKMAEVDENTLTGARAMTPGYSPPEQYGTSRTDARTDVYSLGATLYAALTGFIPEDSLARVVDEVQLTPLRKRNPRVSKRLTTVIEKAMEPQAVNRYQSAEDLKRALLGMELVQSGVEPSPPSDSPTELPNPSLNIQPDSPASSQTSRKSSSLPWVILFGLLLAFAVGVGWLIANPESAPPSLRSYLALIVSPTPEPKATSTPTRRPTSTNTLTPKRPLTLTSTVRSTITATLTARPDNVTETVLPETPLPSPVPTDIATPLPLATFIGGGTGEIAFASTQSGIPQIYLIGADGSNPRALTHELNGACQPAWAPDGKKLVYISPCADKADQYPKAALFVLDIDSGESNSITPPEGDFEPAWSPDGTKIAFSSLREGFLEIYVINLADKLITRLTNLSSTMLSRQPAWSPNGRQIAYTVRRFSLLQIWVMSSDGTNQVQLVRSGGGFSDYLPAWSPNGADIFFSETNASATSPSSLLRLTLGADKSQIVPISLPVVDVDFSQDGNWIVYESSDTKNQDIFIYNLLDNTRQRLTNDSALDFDPAWRPSPK